MWFLRITVFCYVIVMVIHQYEVTGEKMDTKYGLTYLVSMFFSCHLILVVQVAVISMWPAAVVLVLGFSMLPSYKYLLYTLLVYCDHTLTQYIFWFLVGGHGSHEKLVMWPLSCGPGTTCRRGVSVRLYWNCGLICMHNSAAHLFRKLFYANILFFFWIN